MSKMLRNTPTRTSVRFAAAPQAAKHKISKTNGTASPGKTSLALRAFVSVPTAAGSAADAIRFTLPLDRTPVVHRLPLV